MKHKFATTNTGNTRHNQCAGCGELFNSISSFDLHRVGDHGTPQRRCLSPEEMDGLGMSKNRAGFWVKHAYSDEDAAERFGEGRSEARMPTAASEESSRNGAEPDPIPEVVPRAFALSSPVSREGYL